MRVGWLVLAVALPACVFTLNDVRTDEPPATIPQDAAAPDTAADTAPPPRFCAAGSTPHVFCTDFDDGALASGWSISPGKTGESIFAELTTQEFVSPTGAARFGVHAAAATSKETSAAGHFDIARKGERLRLSFAMRVEKLAPGESFSVLYLGMKETGDVRTEIATSDGSTMTITSYPEPLTGMPTPPRVWRSPPKIGEWALVRIDFTLDPPRWVASVGEQSAVDVELTGTWAGATPGFALGMPFVAGQAKDKSILIDNVAFDVE